MTERITVKGADYKVVRRVAVAEMAPYSRRRSACELVQAVGEIYLVKAQGGTRVFCATEYTGGQIGQPIDTHTDVHGYGRR